MFETIAAWGAAKIATYVAGSIGSFVLLWIFKKIDNDKIAKKFDNFFYGLGVTVTAGLSKWKYTSKFWNKIIEPWFIDLIDNVVCSAIKGFIRGLRSDTKKDKNSNPTRTI